MSLWCECIECEGIDPFIICENKLLEAQVSAWRTQTTLHDLKMASLMVSGLIPLLIVALQA